MPIDRPGIGVIGHNWPACDQGTHFDLGHILNSAVTDLLDPPEVGVLSAHHAALWECDLRDNSLIWSGGVYDIFGLERGVAVSRDQVLAHYTEESRAKLERLRNHAVKYGLGFTLDAEIRAAAVGRSRGVRIIGAPVCRNGVALRLHGLKLIL